MNIRKATSDDIPVIHKLANEIWWTTYSSIISNEQISFMLEEIYSETALHAQMEEGIEFFLAEKDGIAVAFASLSASDQDQKVFRIHKLYVLLSEQGQGTGKELIAHIRSLAKDRNYQFLELNVNRGNPAQSFYRKIGFTIHQAVDIPYHHFILNDFVMRLPV